MRKMIARPDVQKKIRAHLHSDSNPFRDPEVTAKGHATLRANGYRHLNGGKGRGLTKAQKFLLDQLPGWVPEHVVTTGWKRPLPLWYAIDVAEPDLLIAIEADGHGHQAPKVKARDARKDALLRSKGWTVLRFRNHEILHETERVLAAIGAAISGRRAAA